VITLPLSLIVLISYESKESEEKGLFLFKI
jgi:hypothetical protein